MRINDDLLINPKVNGSVYADAFKSKNLFDKNSALKGYELNSSTGGTTTKSTYYTSDYIEVEPNTTYYITKGSNSGSSNCFYDSNKNYITVASKISGALTVPNNSNIKYMRMNGLLTDINNVQIERGSTGTELSLFKSYGIETGTNENGTYIKYDDGIMICYGKYTLSDVNFTLIPNTSAYRAAIYPNIKFPVTFSDYPSVFVAPECNNNQDFSFCWIYAIKKTLSQITRIDFIRPLEVTNGVVTIEYMAIGRWK